MNHPPAPHPPALRSQPRLDERNAPAKAKPPASLLQWLWQSWLRLTGPRPERFSADLQTQERLRRSRLLSALLLLIVIALVLVTPTALALPLIWRPVILLALGSVPVALFNRWGLVIAGALLYITLVDGAIAGYILSKPALTSSNLPDFDLFILALLIGGLVLPRQLIPVTAAGHLLLVVLIFQFKPHDPLLIQEMQAHLAGQTYIALVDALLLQVCGALIGWLQAWSVERALLRASRAEELAETRAHLSVQAHQLAEQKARLEQSIARFQEVQVRIANGDYSARATLQENDLLPLAVSFNLMAERLGRVARLEHEHQHLKQAFQALLDACVGLEQGQTITVPPPGGTPADRILPFLARLPQVQQRLAQGQAHAEDLRRLLHRHQEQLVALETALARAVSVASALARAVAHPASPITHQQGSGPLGSAATPEDSPSARRQLRPLIDQEQALLEQAARDCTAARTFCGHGLRGIRLLGQQLTEAR